MHALARSFLVSGDDSTALSVLHEAERGKQFTNTDRIAFTEIKYAIAALYFERGNYQMAAELFYQQLNAPGMFERALSGISWCYIKTGNYEKAETALRKLINQSPESAVGAEGILTLARRYQQTARQAWEKHNYIEKERGRLESLLKRIDEIKSADSIKSKSSAVVRAQEQVQALLTRINQEKVADRPAIIADYTNIDKLCTFIASHYYTGTYQESYFSRSREYILSILDSTLAVMSARTSSDAAAATASDALVNRTRIKKTVEDAALFSVLSLIDRYKWENEYIEWEKKVINRMRIPTSPDSAATGKKDTSQLKTDSAIDSLLQYENAMNKRYTVLLKQRIEGMLAHNLINSDECYLRYQLGELYYREENSGYTEQYEMHEKIAAAAKNEKSGKHDGEGRSLIDLSPPPILDHDKSMRLYRSAIAKSPSSLFAGAATYCLAWCFNDIGKFDSAYYYMEKVAREFPDNPHTPQALMFCGEYMFDKGDLAKALESFSMVMKYPESDWFDEALYKVAWTQYRLSNPEKAISSFLALVDLGSGALGRSILEKESMDYVAISFSEIDASGEKGLQRAAAFAKKLGDKKRGCQILHRLAQIYKDQGRYEMALKTYNLILSTYPNYEMNPQVEAELLRVQEREVPTEVSIAQKYEYFKKYNRKSEWAKKQSDSIRSTADSVTAKMLYDAAVSYHQLALQGSNDTNYQKAISTYTDYVKLYQAWPLANECHYNLAEIQFSLGNYRTAVDEFIAVSKLYPDSKYKETAAWNAIVAAQNILKAETTEKSGKIDVSK
jgi:tetratricopeptide (TPR) repeat protein